MLLYTVKNKNNFINHNEITYSYAYPFNSRIELWSVKIELFQLHFIGNLYLRIENIKLLRLCGNGVILTAGILKRWKNPNGRRPIYCHAMHKSCICISRISHFWRCFAIVTSWGISLICAKFNRIWFSHLSVKSEQDHVRELYQKTYR